MRWHDEAKIKIRITLSDFSVGGTASPRQVRSPLRRSRLLAASLALCVLTRPFVVRFLGAAVTFL
jgi:hypothetical protein